MAMVMIPTRPKNINIIIIRCESALSVGVMSAVSPTVPSAEVVSYRASTKAMSLSATSTTAPSKDNNTISVTMVEATEI